MVKHGDIIRHVASLVLIYWSRNGISRARDLTVVFAIDHAPVKLHSDRVHAAEPRHFIVTPMVPKSLHFAKLLIRLWNDAS